MPRPEAFDHSYIGPCPAHQRREALLKLAGVFDPAWQGALQNALVRAKATPQFDWQGLWVAKRAERIEAALWIEPLADATAQLWLPVRHNSAAEALLASVRQWVGHRGFDLCHITLNKDQRLWKATLAASGMQPIATLEHLKAATEAIKAPITRLRMAPFGELAPTSQLALLEAISEGSLDCPALLEALSMETLLAGFHAQVLGPPEHWYQVLYDGETVGVLLLAPQTPECWELQLMGLVSAWRGNGLGSVLVQEAKALAYQGGASTLSLTVDGHNTPAKRVYTRAGFSCTNQQYLYAWRR